MYTTVAKSDDDKTNATINPAFTEITPRVLPLTFSDRNILWKRLKDQGQDQDKEAGMMVIVKRTASPSSGGVETSSSQPHSPKTLSHHNRDTSINSLAEDFKKLSISPPRRQNSSTSKSNRLPPRSPSLSPSSSPRRSIDAFSGRRKTSSKLSTESHEPLTKQDPSRSSKGFRCTCSKIGGVCGC